jgi:hypothetical protein
MGPKIWRRGARENGIGINESYGCQGNLARRLGSRFRMTVEAPFPSHFMRSLRLPICFALSEDALLVIGEKSGLRPPDENYPALLTDPLESLDPTERQASGNSGSYIDIGHRPGVLYDRTCCICVCHPHERQWGEIQSPRRKCIELCFHARRLL